MPKSITTCTVVSSESMIAMIKESHTAISKNNRHYMDEIEKIKSNIEEQRQIWRKELEDAKEMVEKLVT